MGVSGLGYVGINATDTRAWKDLAVSVFSMEVVDKDQTESFYLRLDEWHHRLSVTASENDSIALWDGRCQTRRALICWLSV